MQDLLEEIIKDLGDRLKNEIDFDILSNMLCEIGWTKVILQPMTAEHGQEIDEWVKQNVKSGMQTMGLVWVFENEKEANWFKLKWL